MLNSVLKKRWTRFSSRGMPIPVGLTSMNHMVIYKTNGDLKERAWTEADRNTDCKRFRPAYLWHVRQSRSHFERYRGS